jgi:hypothetical protein
MKNITIKMKNIFDGPFNRQEIVKESVNLKKCQLQLLKLKCTEKKE